MARVKHLLPKKTKIGHTGTLDPLASGLLVLLIGRSTRLSRYVMGLRKSYTATARLGAVSDTLYVLGGAGGPGHVDSTNAAQALHFRRDDGSGA